jgi:hypothetical protein
MKKMMFLFAAVMLFCTSCSCGSRVQNDDNATGSTKMVSEKRVCRPFTKVSLDGVATIYYTQSDAFSCRIEGQERYVKRMQVDFSNNTISIDGPTGKNNKGGKMKIKVYLSSPDIVEINLNGVGDFIAEKKIDTDNMTVSSDGVGSIRLRDLVCDNLKASLDGVGDIRLDNVDTRHSDLSLDGVGNMSVHFARCDKAEADLDGVGSMKLSGSITHLDKSRGGIGRISYSK